MDIHLACFRQFGNFILLKKIMFLGFALIKETNFEVSLT